VLPPARRYSCAVASAARDEPVWATASQVTAWLLVEVRGPWGRDAIADSELGPHAPRVWREAMRRQGVRVVAIRRDLTRQHRGVRLVHVVAPRPGVVAPSCRHLEVDDLHDVVAATAPLTTRHPLGPAWTEDADRYVLVCTNGRHDACCATFGRPLVRALRESRWSDQVWECSHIGGDRFAGNLVILPDSLYFGRRDPAAAARLLAAHADGQLELQGFRGRTTFRLAEQAAEHFVRVERGLPALDAVRGIDPIDDTTMEVAVIERGAPVRYRVTVERTTVPARTPLTCTGKLGLSYAAFRLVDLSVT